MQRRKSFFNNEMEQRFSLRKYTIGLCSVCLGFVTIGMGSQTVKADTVNNVEKSSVVQENKMQDAAPANTAVSTEVKANTPDSANITPTETKENETGSVATTAPKTNTASNGVKANTADSATSTETKPTKANSTVANSNIVSAQAKSTKAESVVQPKVSATSTEAKLNETDSVVVKPNAASKEAKPNIADSATLAKIKLQTIKLAKPADAKALAESKVATDNQFNFDDWTTQIDNTYLSITGYTGDRSKQIVVPNGADFANAGKNDKNLQVEIDKDTLAGLIVDGVAPKLSSTDGRKIVAKGNDWSNAFSWKDLHDISGLANLDTSNVTNMDEMFEGNQISDLSPIANWNIGNVTEMSNMFSSNQISDLSPLAHWKTGNVTDMSGMFKSNQISDLSPLTNWDTSKVTNMSEMFGYNSDITDLSPIANWNMSSVSDLSDLFESNTQLNLTDINNTKLMQAFLKEPDALGDATFITNNADLVKAITGQDLKDNLNGTAHRHIIVETPDHKDENSHTSQTIDQTIDYSRDAKVDTVTGEVNSYTPWTATDSTKTSFDEKHIDAIDGYDISVEGATEGTDYVVNKDGSITINANTPDPTKFANSVTDFDPTKILPNSTITVKYTAQKKTVTIHYVDDDNNGQPAKDTQDKTINAVTDQNLYGSQLTYDVPSIYHLADNSGEVTTFHVNADDSKNVITVHLKQNTGVPIDPDNIPDGTKNPEDGDKPITKDEFTHDVHRTVTVDYPASYTGEKPDLSQTITLSRTATYNQVTGVVTWSAWSTGKFDAETPVAIAGYTPSVSSIAEMPVTHDTADQAVHITYMTAGNKGQGSTTVDNKGQGTTTADNKGQGTTTAGNKGQGTMTDDNKGQGSTTNNNKNDEKSAKDVVKKSSKGLDTKSSSKKIAKTMTNAGPKNADNGEGAGIHTAQAATVNNGSKDLPQTGEKQGVMASILGALAVGFGILGLAGAKRKKKN